MNQLSRAFLILFLVCLAVVTLYVPSPSLGDQLVRWAMWIGVVLAGASFILYRGE